MENETEIIEICPKNMYTPICIVQAVCVAIVLIVMIVIKMFFNGFYTNLEKWCTENFFEETVITADFDEEV